MRKVLLAFAVACGPTVKNPPPPPTSTTAMLFFSDFQAGYSVEALDVKTHAGGTVLQSEALGSDDAFVRVFGRTLYVITRAYKGEANAVTVISPADNYQPGCSAGGACQFSLGFGANPQDFWAVSPTKAYITLQPDPSAPEAPQYALRNTVLSVNPDTGEVLKKIDLKARMLAAGIDLGAEDKDDNFEPSALYADDKHLFIGLQLLGSFAPIPTNNDCGFVASRVAVLDIDTDELVTVIALKGSNPSTRFIPELNTDNLLIATAGSLGSPSIEACNGIERINQRTLTLGAPMTSEATLGGTVISFAVGADGRGVAFLFTGGDYLKPIYQVSQFDKNGLVGTPLQAPGAGGFTQPGFVIANDRGEAYLGLPLTKGPSIRVVDLSTAEERSVIDVANKPIDIALYPGTPYTR